MEQLRRTAALEQQMETIEHEAVQSGGGLPAVLAVMDTPDDPHAERRQRLRIQRLERVRYDNARMQRIADKVMELNVQLPKLCPCIHETDPLDSRYPFRCSNNCHLYRNPEAYSQALFQVLFAYNIIAQP